MWCSTCGKDSATSECQTCAQWWKDNEPVTVSELLAAHAQFGQMDKAMTKAAMGANWPPEWDDLPEGPGSIFHAKQPEEGTSHGLHGQSETTNRCRLRD